MTAHTLTARTITTDAATWALRRADGVGWDFELPGEKATVGSGQSCTVRLIDHGVRPLHCLITRGDRGFTVRRWSDDTLLNGEVFTEAALEPGDRLTIGPVELILEGSSAPQPSEESYAVEETPAAEPEGAVNRLADQVEQLLTPTSSTASTGKGTGKRGDSNRRRAKQLVELVRQERGECQRLAMEIASLESRLASTETERERLVFERDELAGRLASLTNEVSQVRDEVQALSASHHEREQALEGRLSDLEQQIAERDSLVVELRDELERQRTAATEQFRTELPSNQVAEQQDPSTAQPTSLAEGASELRGEEAYSHKVEKFVEAATIDWWKDAPRIELPSSAAVEPEASFELAPESVGPLDDYLPVEVGSRELSHDPTADAAKTDSETSSRESLWDIEVQSPASHESETAEVVESRSPGFEGTGAIEPELQVSSAHDHADHGTEPVRSEEDLWGRLSSLRAEASERLHYEVEHPEAVSETSHDFWAAPSMEVESETEAAPETRDEEASFEAPAAFVEPEATQADTQADTHAEPETEAEAPTETELELEAPAPVKREEPVSFIEKYKHLLDDEDPAPAPAIPTYHEPTPVAKAVPNDDPGDDESIEAYMEKMMARLRGEPAGPTLMGDRKQLEAQAIKEVVAPPQPVVLTPSVPVKPLEDLQEIKSGPSPEHSTDMTMLRNLANNSAREAIKIAHSRRQREQTRSNLLMCLIGCVSGGFLVWASKGHLGMPLYAGAGAIAAAGYWAVRCVRSLFAAGQPKSARREEEMPAEAALPIR